MNDKRKLHRLAAQDPVGCWIQSSNEEGAPVAGVLHDLTKKGACLSLLEKIQVGDRITIGFNMPSFDLPADVKWVKEVQENTYMAGILFL